MTAPTTPQIRPHSEAERHAMRAEAARAEFDKARARMTHHTLVAAVAAAREHCPTATTLEITVNDDAQLTIWPHRILTAEGETMSVEVDPPEELAQVLLNVTLYDVRRVVAFNEPDVASLDIDTWLRRDERETVEAFLRGA